MVAGGNRLSLTGAVAETGSAEQGTASSTSHGRFINIVPNTRTNNIKLYGITANQKYKILLCRCGDGCRWQPLIADRSGSGDRLGGTGDGD